jgi:hypothetical protein
MTKLSFMTPDRHFVGPNFEKCLTKFTNAGEMARCTGISHSSINHILRGRPISFESTRKRYEAQCGAYLDGQQPKPLTPHIPTTPAQQALDLNPQAVFVVCVPAANAAKLQKVLAMFGAEMVEVD